TPNTPLVINEVIQNNDQIDDAIELFNTGSDPIDLSGWALSDDKNTMTIADGTVIDAGQYLAITTDDDTLPDKFGLGKNDEANIHTPDGVLVDHFAWEGHQPTSYGRCPDGTGDFGVTVEATPGAANACTASSVGNVGSGTALMSSRLLRLAGLDVATENGLPSVSSVTMQPLGLNDGIIALTEGSVDVLFWSGGVPPAA